MTDAPLGVNLALSHLAADEAELLAGLADARADLEGYRTALQVALEQLNRAQATIRRQTQTISRLQEVVRAYIEVPSTDSNKTEVAA